MNKSPIKEIEGGVRLSLYLQPRASKNSIVGLHDDCIKIKVTAPPFDNEANLELINYLSKLLKISKKSISIVSGMKSRRKVVEIVGMDYKNLRSILNANL